MTRLRTKVVRARPLESALLGFGITLVPVAALACCQFLAASEIVKIAYHVDPEAAPGAVPALREGLVLFYAAIAGFLAVHWLLAAAFGKANVLLVKCANILLALAGLVIAAGVIIASFLPVPDTFVAVCPLLGLSNTLPPLPERTFGFDQQSPCVAFLTSTVPKAQAWTFYILLLSSTILRTLKSRQ